MIYENLTKNTNTIKNVFNVHFVEGPFIEIKSTNEDEFYCEFINQDTNVVEYSTTLKNNHLGTEVVVKYDEHYKLNWEEVADKLVGAFGGYVWCKGGFETYLLPTEFHTEKLYEFNR